MDDVFAHALKKQTGVALKYMLDFGANPIERQLVLSAQVRAASARPPRWKHCSVGYQKQACEVLLSPTTL